MKLQIPQINFDNINNPVSYFDMVKLEELLNRDLNHDISKNHLVKFFILFFVLDGKGKHNIDFKDYSYEPGTILLIRKNQIHKFYKNNDAKGYLLVFTEEFIIGHLNRMEALKTMQLFNDSLSYPKIVFNNKRELADFTVLIKHMESEYLNKDDFSIGITRSVLHIVITKLFRSKSKAGDFVKDKKHLDQFLEFQKMLEEHCFESRKVEHYAKKLNVSPKTLNSIVNHVVHISAKTFIDERTTMQIKRLLIATDQSIKEIAYQSGFSDPSNFFKYFKNITGTSPEAFRKAH